MDMQRLHSRCFSEQQIGAAGVGVNSAGKHRHAPQSWCAPALHSGGILTQKCQRSQSWFIRIPLACFSVLSPAYHCHHAEMCVCEWGGAFVHLQCGQLQGHMWYVQSSFANTLNHFSPLPDFQLKLAAVQIFHTVPRSSVAKAVVVKF